MLGKCSNLQQLCIPGIKYIAMHCIYQNQRKLFAFLMLMFLARTEKEEIEYCALTVGKRKDLSHFPNESDYWTRNHCHHQSLSLSSLSSSSYSSLSHGSKQAMDLLLWRRRKKTWNKYGRKSDLYKKYNCIWLFKLDMQDLLTEMNKNGSLFTPRYVRKIIQISPWPLRFLRSDPWDIGKLGVDGQGPSSFSVPRPLHTSLTSSSSSHYLSTFISPTLSSSSSRIVIKPVFYGKIN